MRDFFISSFEKLVGLIIILAAIGVVIGGFGAMFSPGSGVVGGFFAGVFVWVIGAMYVVLMGGTLYLGLGIYQNTKRMAEAMERSDS